MSNIITTLHPQGAPTDDLYPNVLSDNIPSNAITTAKINDNAVTSDKIQHGAVTNVKIQNASVSTNKLQDEAVTTAKIQDGAITYTKIADEAVTYKKLHDEAVITSKIQDQAVTRDKIKDGAVGEYQLDYGAVNTDNIEDEAVTPDKLSTRLYIHQIRANLTDSNRSYMGTLTFNIINNSDSSLVEDFDTLKNGLVNYIYTNVYDTSNDCIGQISSITSTIDVYLNYNNNWIEYEFDSLDINHSTDTIVTLL